MELWNMSHPEEVRFGSLGFVESSGGTGRKSQNDVMLSASWMLTFFTGL